MKLKLSCMSQSFIFLPKLRSGLPRVNITARYFEPNDRSFALVFDNDTGRLTRAAQSALFQIRGRIILFITMIIPY